MTFWAKKSEHGPSIEVMVTYGPVTVTVVEDAGSLRYFWGQLGNVLEQAEQAAGTPAPAP